MYIVESLLNAMNQNPEQLATDLIYKQLTACGWVIQIKNQIKLKISTGVALGEPNRYRSAE